MSTIHSDFHFCEQRVYGRHLQFCEKPILYGLLLVHWRGRERTLAEYTEYRPDQHMNVQTRTKAQIMSVLHHEQLPQKISSNTSPKTVLDTAIDTIVAIIRHGWSMHLFLETACQF